MNTLPILVKLRPIGLAIAIAACAMAPLAATQAASAAELPVAESTDIRTGAYTYAGHGSVNTHWIVTPAGVIVIDVQRDLGHAKEALDAVKRLKIPVLAVLVTHGHPDHYAGIGLFKTQWPQATVWSSKTTYDTIKDDHYGFNKLAAELAKGNFPDPVVLPDRTFADNETLLIGGVQVVSREMGKAESNGATVFYLPATGDLYAGDLVLNRMHGFFYEGASLENLAVLDRLGSLFPNAKTMHPGHGNAGPAAEVIARHRDYIVQARKMAARALAKSGNPATGRADVVKSLKAKYPNFGIPGGQPDMIEVSVKGLFDELATPTQTPVR
jgi:glyoxylase-like metal-dependent hydrolase (beta-lactamase superfamily II)